MARPGSHAGDLAKRRRNALTPKPRGRWRRVPLTFGSGTSRRVGSGPFSVPLADRLATRAVPLRSRRNEQIPHEREDRASLVQRVRHADTSHQPPILGNPSAGIKSRGRRRRRCSVGPDPAMSPLMQDHLRRSSPVVVNKVAGCPHRNEDVSAFDPRTPAVALVDPARE